MTLIQISLLITFISGFLITTYPIYAVKRGWPIGEILSNETGIIRTLGGLSMIASIFMFFIYFKWFVSIGIIIGLFLLGFIISSIFKSLTQLLSIAGLFAGITMGLIYYLTWKSRLNNIRVTKVQIEQYNLHCSIKD